MLVIPILSVVLLLAGMVARSMSHAPEPLPNRQLWKLRASFQTRRDYRLFTGGTISIAAGALLLTIWSISKVF